jgi:hypothetical protein
MTVRVHPFEEIKHPRDRVGRFAHKAGGGIGAPIAVKVKKRRKSLPLYSSMSLSRLEDSYSKIVADKTMPAAEKQRHLDAITTQISHKSPELHGKQGAVQGNLPDRLGRKVTWADWKKAKPGTIVRHNESGREGTLVKTVLPKRASARYAVVRWHNDKLGRPTDDESKMTTGRVIAPAFDLTPVDQQSAPNQGPSRISSGPLKGVPIIDTVIRKGDRVTITRRGKKVEGVVTYTTNTKYEVKIQENGKTKVVKVNWDKVEKASKSEANQGPSLKRPKKSAKAQAHTPAVPEHAPVRPGEPREAEESHTLDLPHAEVVRDAVGKLRRGAAATVRAEHLAALAKQMSESEEPVNLSMLHVEKYNHGNLFDKHETETPRSMMPQIPTSAENLQSFMAHLDQAGIRGHIESVSPSLLHATQNELDGRKAAGIAANYDPSKGGVLFVDRNGAVLDGHHRWAAAVLHEAENPGYEVDILRIDADIAQLLILAEEWDQLQGIQHLGFGAAD